MALFTKNLRKHIFVHPAHQNKLHVAVKSALLRDKRKFCDRLGGALLDASNLKVLGKQYLIVDGFLSMEVEADFRVFCPNVGMDLKGTVNRISKGHIGCLVMDVFNASLAKPPNSTVALEIGDECDFSVKEVTINGDILSLKGSLSPAHFEENDVGTSEDIKDIKFFDENIDTVEKEVPEKDLVERDVKPDPSVLLEGILKQKEPSLESPMIQRKIKEEFPSGNQIDVNSVVVKLEPKDESLAGKRKSPKKKKHKKAGLDLLEIIDLIDESPSPPKKVKKSKKTERLHS